MVDNNQSYQVGELDTNTHTQ